MREISGTHSSKHGCPLSNCGEQDSNDSVSSARPDVVRHYAAPMTAQIINGAAIAGEIRAALARQTEQMLGDGLLPQLAVLLVGDNPASASYVRGKERAGAGDRDPGRHSSHRR